MKVQKRKWVIAAAIAILFLTVFLWAEWFLQMQKPLCIKMLGDEEIRHVEAGCASTDGWQYEELSYQEIQRLVRTMNRIQGERIAPRPHRTASGKRMIFSIEKTDGERQYVTFSDQTLTIDNKVTYLLSKRDARQIEHLFGEIL